MMRVWWLINQQKRSCDEWLPDCGRKHAFILGLMKLS